MPTKCINTIGISIFFKFQTSWPGLPKVGLSIYPYYMKPKIGLRAAWIYLLLKTGADNHRLWRASTFTGYNSYFYNWCYWRHDIVVTKHFSAISTSSCGGSTDSLLAHEDWIPQLCEWPLLHSSLLCSVPAEMQPRERTWNAERQTPSRWDQCLGINPERHWHIVGPQNHSEPMARALHTSTTWNLWVTPQTEAKKPQQKQKACLHLIMAGIKFTSWVSV